MNRQEIGRLVAVCLTSYPNHSASADDVITAWEFALAELPYDAAAAAIKVHMKESPFFPAPSEIYQRVIDQTGALPSGGDAWGMVQARLSAAYLGYPASTWDAPYPVRQAVTAMGGMHQLRMSENPMADRAHFIRFYEDIRKQAARNVDIAALIEHGATALEPSFGTLRVLSSETSA